MVETPDISSKLRKRIKTRIKNVVNTIINGYVSLRIQAKREPYKFLFILSHMRSGSTLLIHILNTSSEISGFGENHVSYSSEKDLKALILRTAWRLRKFNMTTKKYIVDKILHNRFTFNKELIRSEHIYAIFLLREPKESLASISNLYPEWTEEKTINYYTSRLLKLEDYAKTIDSKAHSLFITHKQILNQTELVFEKLQNFLGVQQPFSEQYETLAVTGIPYIGDLSENIKAGRILRNYKSKEFQITPELLEKASNAFEQCSATLCEYCTVISTP